MERVGQPVGFHRGILIVYMLLAGKPTSIALI